MVQRRQRPLDQSLATKTEHQICIFVHELPLVPGRNTSYKLDFTTSIDLYGCSNNTWCLNHNYVFKQCNGTKVFRF